MTTDPASPAPSWHLTAQLQPGPAPEPDAAEDSDAVRATPPEWEATAADVRTTVKWMVGALGAIGAVLFAQGLISTPDLNWDDDRSNLVAAWFLGALGLLGIGWLIHEAVGVLRPTALELRSLPVGYQRVIQADPRFYLPDGVDTIDQFAQNYRQLRLEEATWRDQVARRRSTLASVTASGPPEAVAEAQALLAEDEEVLRSIRQALEVYLLYRDQLVDRATYWSASQGLQGAGPKILVAAFCAAFGGIGYQLVLAPSGSDDPAPAPPRVAQLTQTDTAAGRQLWTAMTLAPCQADPEAAVISVVVSGGKGTPDEPYTVSTLPDGDCLARTFNVIDAVALVSEAAPPTEITYERAPLRAPWDQRSGT